MGHSTPKHHHIDSENFCMMTSTTKTMVLLIAIMMLADKINAGIAGCNQRNTCSRNSGREERLWNAAKAGNLAEVKQLLQNTYVDPTSDGVVPLIIAALKGHEDVIRVLLDNNANIDHQDSRGYTPLIYAGFLSASQGKDEVVRLLLQRGANTKLKTIDGRTACDMNRSGITIRC